MNPHSDRISPTAAQQADAGLNVRSILLPYTLVLIALCVVIQLIVAIRGSSIDGVSQALLTVVAAYCAWFSWRGGGTRLKHIRFGELVYHGVNYVVVNTSFHVHAAVLAFQNSDALGGSRDFPIDSGWFGVTIGMAGFWGIGFLMHAVASIAKRGYENAFSD